jgi:hypothetical protein
MPPSTSASPDWFTLGMGLCGGLALFFYGLNQLSNGLKHAAVAVAAIALLFATACGKRKEAFANETVRPVKIFKFGPLS